jgi:hypothetical protein
MDGPTFDVLVKQLTQKRLTRLALLRGVAASALGGVTGATLAEARAQQARVTLCHKPGTADEATIEVAEPAAEAHLGHGDTLGPCCPNLICRVQSAYCDEDGDDVCSTVRSVDAQSCICGNDICGPSCSTDDDCQSYAPGAICQAPETGCCGQRCIAPCHAFDSSRAEVRRSLKGSNAGE